MTATTPGRIGVMTVTGRGVSSTRTDVDVRGMAFAIDEPPERGGDNAGPTPPETLLAALVGCTNRICHKIAAANGVIIQDMSIGLDARFDRNGVNLDEEIDLPIIDITLRIDITTDASDADVAKIKSDLGKFCPVSKILRRAGTEITEIWTVHPI